MKHACGHVWWHNAQIEIFPCRDRAQSDRARTETKDLDEKWRLRPISIQTDSIRGPSAASKNRGDGPRFCDIAALDPLELARVGLVRSIYARAASSPRSRRCFFEIAAFLTELEKCSESMRTWRKWKISSKDCERTTFRFKMTSIEFRPRPRKIEAEIFRGRGRTSIDVRLNRN